MTRPNRFAKAKWWRFATHNVMENPLHRDTIPATITEALTGNDIVMWTELSDDYAEGVLVKRHPNYGHFVPAQKHNDARISYLKPLRLIRSGRKEFQTHKADVSHERYITWADIFGFPGAPIIRVSSRHYWPGAFNTSRKDMRLRRDQWMRGQGTDFDFMADTANQTGMPQVAGGDYNRLGNFFPKTIGGYKVHHFSKGLDHIVFVDGKFHRWTFPRVRKTITKDTASDHDVLIVLARLVRR